MDYYKDKEEPLNKEVYYGYVHIHRCMKMYEHVLCNCHMFLSQN